MESAPAGPRLLLGRRGDRHVFMPGKYVFPGGRVDPSDLRLARALAFEGPVIERLLHGTGGTFDAFRGAAVALAAIRETFEEAGLLIGTLGAGSGALAGGAPWSAFADGDVGPDPSVLVPVARAITPPGHVRRYDTRFFCVGTEAIAARVPFEERTDPELDSLGWFGLDEVEGLDLPSITRRVLGDLEPQLRDGSWRTVGASMPFYHMRHHRHVRDLI